MSETRIAKQDVVAVVDGVKRKVAIKGQPVPRMFADVVDDSDTEPVEKTRRKAPAPAPDDEPAKARRRASTKKRTTSKNKARKVADDE